jgi:alpha-tubulin suppressor-like RCC1 family protein
MGGGRDESGFSHGQGGAVTESRCWCATSVRLACLLAGMAMWFCAAATERADGAVTAQSVAVGGWQSCTALSSGHVYCWGLNNEGQLGNGTTTSSDLRVEAKGVTGAVDVAAGSVHSCAALSSGRIDCWGWNYYGQLGNGSTISSDTPVQVSGITNAVQVVAGTGYSCALVSTGHVECWGENHYGQLGNGTTTNSNTPVEVSGITNASQLTVGSDHSCALLSSGQVDCWGSNDVGQLGNGTGANSDTPVAVIGITNATGVAAGGEEYVEHSCAVLSTGHVECWGENHSGELGNGTTEPSYTPVVVTGIANATQVDAGEADSCAVLSAGRVDCWGFNGFGELGNGTTTGSDTPVEVTGLAGATQVATWRLHLCAVLSSGRVVCWGYNAYGELGNGIVGGQSNTPVETQGITNAANVAAGRWYSCAILTTSHIDCWGENRDGELGIGGTTSSETPVEVQGITTAAQLAAGGEHSCAVLSTKHIDCWGWNRSGQLGNGTTTESNTPVEVTGISTASEVAAGGEDSCAVLSSKHVDCWGWNHVGQLGNGTTTQSNTPVEVKGVTSGAQVAAGAEDSCAVLATGHVDCWGENAYGELGNGSTSSSLTPVEVKGITNAVQVVAGPAFSCAVLSTGHVDCWGANEAGQLGNGTQAGSDTPVEVQGITTAKEVVAGGEETYAEYSCALLSTGHVDCWGANEAGQLGNGTEVSSDTPVEVAGIATATEVAANGEEPYASHTCAALSTGHVKCWGSDESGQLGTGTLWSALPTEVLEMPPKAPGTTTGGSASVSQGAATLTGTVDPEGVTVSSCVFEYGPTDSYGSSVPCASLPGSGTSAVEVSAPISGLTANSTYHFRIVATNAEGSSEGGDVMFATLPEPPTLVTGIASSITQTSATLGASVNPNGGNVTACAIEYGTSLPSEASVPCSPSPGFGTSAASVSGAVVGLAANTGYEYRVTATNAGGTSTGSTQSFMTLPVEPSPPTASIEAPLGGGVYGEGEVVSTSFSCTEGAYGPGIASCTDSHEGSGSSGTLDTSTAGQHTYVVTAKSQDGQSAKAEISYTVERPSPPTASIEVPRPGGVYGENDVVATSFSCTEGAYGPGIASCTDSHGGSGSSGTLDTSTLGLHAYVVSAKSKDGQNASAEISYTVGEAGQCRALNKNTTPKIKHGQYIDSKCESLSEKKGKPSAKGSFEWFPGPPADCVAEKKGEYTDAACSTKSAKAHKGSFERQSCYPDCSGETEYRKPPE